MELPIRIKDLLKKRDMTVADLSKMTKVPVNTLHNWIAGQPPRNIVQLKRVADFFCVTVDYLAFGTCQLVDYTKLPEIMLNGSFEVILRPTNKGAERV